MISADKANIPLPFKRAAAIDLAGRNVLEAVQRSMLPKVIETPKIAAVAKDDPRSAGAVRRSHSFEGLELRHET